MKSAPPSVARSSSSGVRSSRARLVVFLACGLLWFGCQRGSVADVEPSTAVWPLSGKSDRVASGNGMVVTGHPLASEVGVLVLERGGNAIDAAVAISFALAVVLPEAGNLGGGGFLVHRSTDGEVRTLDFRERAPAMATHDMYLDQSGEPTDRSVIGHLAAGVPGSVAGMWEMHRELGSVDWRELLTPAVDLAHSHPMDQVRSDHLRSAAAKLGLFEASAAQFLPGGEPPAPGVDWSQPDLKKTLEAIRDGGAEAFYRGPIAELVVAEMKRGDGIIQLRDLAEYRAVWRQPVVAEYRGRTIYSMPPPSSGGVTLALILNILEGFDPLPAFGSVDLIHLEAEAMRRAFTDRNRYLGDPDFVDLPLDRLQSQEYADQLRAEIDPERATPTPPFALDAPEGTNTTHYSIVDAAGNAVAVTTTLNGSFGSGVTVTGAGFLLNNEMDDFAAAPGKPNQYGLVEAEANSIAPGKTMLSSMTPSVVLDKNGDLEMIVGSPGGPTIITTVYHVISNRVDHQMSLSQAVESPRVHHQALPDKLFFEHQALSAEIQTALEARGHQLSERREYSGDVSAIVRDGERWVGVADPRRGGGASAPQSVPSGTPRPD